MRAARTAFAGFLILALIAAAVYIFRLPITSFAVKSAMARAGLENPTVEAVALSFRGISLRNIAAGPVDGAVLEIAEIEARYDWRKLIADQRVENVRVGPGTVRLMVSSDGEFSLPGVSLRGGDKDADGFKLPFSALVIDDMAVNVDTPIGVSRGMFSTEFNSTTGGGVRLHLEAEKSGTDAAYVENGVFDVDLDLSETGAIIGAATFRGAVISPYGAVRDLDVMMTSEGRSWRDLVNGLGDALEGRLRAEIKSAMVSASDLPSTSVRITEQGALVFGEPVSVLSITGKMDVSLADGVLSANLGRAPLVVDADNGAQLVIAKLPDDPFFWRSDDASQANFSFDLSGSRVVANGTVNAETTEDGWYIVTPLRIGDYRSKAVSFDDASAIMRVTLRPGGASADITTTTNIRSLSVGRLSVYDTPFSANFLVDTDNATKTARLTLPQGQCFTIGHGHITIAQQDTEATVKDAKLCSQDRPLAILDWADDIRSDFAGSLSASYMHYRLGQTNISGRSPVIGVSGVYQPTVNQTIASGDISGGALTFNDMLVFSSIDGKYDFLLDRQVMGATMQLHSVRITQNEKNPRIAPMLGSGEARLVGKEADFDYVLETPAGERLGVGSGIHNVETARGSSTFIIDRLEFQPGGLQPEMLAPVLKGVIGETTGASVGEANFSWAPNAKSITSSASIIISDMTFGGPTRVVTQTIGVNGQLDLASLWPVTTDGEQMVRLSGIDFGALQLEQGVIKFDMPGDDSLHVNEAAFPWFGGVLGVRHAKASFTGGEAAVQLKADNIDLTQILVYANVDGLSGEGTLSGVLPLLVEDGKARIENGLLYSTTPGALRYRGKVSGEASAAGKDAQLAFDLLRDLRFSGLGITVNGPLDGTLLFQLNFEGTGEVEVNEASGRVPVRYQINLEAAVLDLIDQAALSRNIQLQVRKGFEDNP